jgi:uncharacterized lipoprotein YddW (UPF0748 family)
MHKTHLTRIALGLGALSACSIPLVKAVSADTPSTVSISASHQRTASMPAEVRGLWVVRTSITDPQSIRNIVATAKAHNFNTLFVQVRGRGDAYYKSHFEPRAEELASAPADFDPLQYMITLAHANGLQVHAWMNSCYVWGDSHMPKSPEHVLNAHPDWIDRDSHGQYHVGKGANCEGAFLSPANLDARKHIHDVFLDVVRNYDVDGIHLDYIRYPSPAYDYSYASRTRFAAEMDAIHTPEQVARIHAALAHDPLVYEHWFAPQFQDFRRRQVTDLVREISQDAKAIKPWLVVSAAVFADYDDAYHLRGQDWKTWLRDGYVDAVAPMAYGTSTAKVAAQIEDAVRCAHESGRMVFAGIGAWHIPANSTIEKIGAARAIGANGEVLFSYGGVTHDGATTAYLDKVSSACFRTQARVPAMPWLGTRRGVASTTQTKESNGG